MPVALKVKMASAAAGGATILTLTGLTMFMGAGDDQANNCTGGGSSGVIGMASSGSGDTGQPVDLKGLPPKVGEYSGQQIVIAAHIIKAGQDAGLDRHGQTIGVMVGMGESGLRNIDYGDAAGPDSRGVFAQRDIPSVYGSYADRMNPDHAAAVFFKGLKTKVSNYKSLAPSEAAHRVQNNADPNHYTKWWEQAKQVVAAVTKDPNVLNQLPSAGSGAGSESCEGQYLPGNGVGEKVFNLAKKKYDQRQKYVLGGGLIGRPWSESGPGGQPRPGGLEGTDCSGLARWAYATATDGKFVMTHLAAGQWDWVKQHKAQVNIKDIQPGDLLFFHGQQPGHVAIAGPNGDLVEQAGPDGKPAQYVKDWQHSSRWHQQTFIGAGRPSTADVSGGGNPSASATN